ncbi:hypothetical protein T01_1176 [Trichinella spiralis]|uniref:Uncharacterized protein n=1 Tax=Trichinella spiralis TaxID=6334 RepID=A0A0V1AMG3_TRISP|nr:hypothetical protein T01_1176 [Trichinella spiralis]
MRQNIRIDLISPNELCLLFAANVIVTVSDVSC